MSLSSWVRGSEEEAASECADEPHSWVWPRSSLRDSEEALLLAALLGLRPEPPLPCIFWLPVHSLAPATPAMVATGARVPREDPVAAPPQGPASDPTAASYHAPFKRPGTCGGLPTGPELPEGLGDAAASLTLPGLHALSAPLPLRFPAATQVGDQDDGLIATDAGSAPGLLTQAEGLALAAGTFTAHKAEAGRLRGLPDTAAAIATACSSLDVAAK